MLNVKDYGATGTGTVDDTAAIQVAINMAQSMLTSNQPPGGSFQGGQPSVHFPPGKYRISSPITIRGGYATIVGEDAIIVQSDQNANALDFIDCYRHRVECLNFVGGKRQIAFSNANVDTTRLMIRGCTFQGWSDCAVSAEGTVGDLHMSASLVIDGCVWDGGRGLVTRCDFTRVRDSVVLYRGSTIVDGGSWCRAPHIGGQTVFSGCVMTPSLPQISGRNANVYWIDNAGSFVAEATRFGGEGGGAPIVRHTSGPNLVNPWRGTLIALENCQANCGKDADPLAAIITLAGGVPQCIRISGCNGLVSNSIPVIRVATGFNLAAAVNSISTSAAPSLQMYSVSIHDNQFYAPQPIPTPLQQFVK